MKFNVLGASHEEFIGIEIFDLPKNEKIDFDELQKFVSLRSPGKSELASPRAEKDKIEIVSGLDGNVLNGDVFKAIIRNESVRSQDYVPVLRPGHADFPAFIRDGVLPPGGGRFSGRMTAATAIAGGIAMQLLAKKGIFLDAHILSVANEFDKKFDSLSLEKTETYKSDFPVLDALAGEKMKNAILSAKQDGNSQGGTVECKIVGVPAGIGGEFFDRLDARIAQAVISIPGCKGVEFGLGFASSKISGYENNDFLVCENGKIKQTSNNCGGILGGLSTGAPIIFSVAFKPTPSISKVQPSVDASGRQVEFSCLGRHDACIVPRALYAVLSVSAMTLFDFLGGK